ncbi:DUF1963 domain-containing protein [Tropicibacter sp. S64]|uniref:DUF1963 domain-containing protein n=1 Tax=Tropicibacter sp. S64 TaxID=3415122 RepID=UPI003C7CD7B1
MVYAARSVFLVGTGILIFGTIWAAAIWKNVIFLLPPFWDQPFTAIALMALGGGLSVLGKRMGGDVFDDAEPITEYGANAAGIASFLQDRMRAFKRGRATPVSGAAPHRDTKMHAYSEMLQEAPDSAFETEAPGESQAPASPVRNTGRKPASGRDAQEVLIAPEQRAEVIAQLLAGGVKAAERFMARNAGGASDPVEMPKQHVASRQAPEATPETDAPGKAVDFRTGRLRLEIRFPQEPTDSWIGGGPSLPEGMDWPRIGDKPASFYAQIALTDLPGTLWGGLGPRSGWLVIFAADDPSAEVVVLHTQERGTVRSLPEGADYYFPFESGEEALAELIGPEALCPPRWYLTAVTDDSDDRPELGAVSPFAALLEKPTMTDPGFLPFDWVTMVALLDAADRMMLRLIERGRVGAEGDAGKAAIVDGMTATLERLRRLSEKVEARAEVAPFSERDCAKVIGALAKLTNEGWMSAKSRAEGRKPLSLLQFPGYKSYRKLYEAQARRVYAADPAALPEATLTRLVPVWEAFAAQEVLYLGNGAADAADGRLPADAPCLLLMPPSALAGWQIGDVSRWAVQIAPRDLALGRFGQAFSSNSHGGTFAG